MTPEKIKGKKTKELPGEKSVSLILSLNLFSVTNALKEEVLPGAIEVASLF